MVMVGETVLEVVIEDDLKWDREEAEEEEEEAEEEEAEEEEEEEEECANVVRRIAVEKGWLDDVVGEDEEEERR